MGINLFGFARISRPGKSIYEWAGENFLLDRLNILSISYAKRNTPAEAKIVNQSLRVKGANPIKVFIEGV